MMIDTNLLVRRQQDLAISDRELCRQLGVTAAVLRRLVDGTNHKDLTLGLVYQLADTLELPIAELLHDETSETDSQPDTTGQLDDAAKVVASLFEVGTLTPIEAIADTNNWTLERTKTAIEQADQHLRQIGLCIHELKNDITIQRNGTTLNTTDLEQLVKGHHARRGLDQDEANMLHWIHQGTAPRRAQTNPRRVTLAQLRNAGLATRDSAPQLTDSVRHSLLLDQDT